MTCFRSYHSHQPITQLYGLPHQGQAFGAISLGVVSLFSWMHADH